MSAPTEAHPSVEPPLAVILGGTGFLGQALSSRFASAFRVRVVGRRAPARTGSGTFEFRMADVADGQALRRALDGAHYVVHLASSALPGPSNEDPRRDAETSLSEGITVLEACRQAGVQCLLYASSGGAIYGAGGGAALSEEAPTDPLSSYGVTRLALEKYLALFRRLHGLDYRVLRIANAYGPGQPDHRTQGLVSVSLARSIDGAPLHVWGDGSAVRDYVYADDVADAFLAATRPLHPAAPRVFNVGTGQGHSVREVLALVERTTGRPLSVVWREPRACDPSRIVLSTQRAREVLGWCAHTPLGEGIRLTWERTSARARVWTAAAPRPRVSVVIPTYNCARLLPLAVESAFQQTLPPEQVVVVDDGSTDTTPELLRDLAARYGERLTCVRKANAGEASARNAGVAAARHEVIAFLDQDDRWLPEKLQTQVEALVAQPGADLVFSAYWRVTPQGDRSLVRLGEWEEDPAYAWRALIVGSCMTPSTVIVRKSALQAVGGFDGTLRMGCDWDMWLRLTIAGIRARYVPAPLTEYLWHQGNLSGNARAVSAAAQEIFARLFRRRDLPSAFRAEEHRCRGRWQMIHAENCLAAGDGREATRQILRAIVTTPWAVRPGWIRILWRGLGAASAAGQGPGFRNANSPHA